MKSFPTGQDVLKLTVVFAFCSYVLLELVETEKDYVRDLGLVVEVSDLFRGLNIVLFF